MMSMKIIQLPIERDSDASLHARRARLLAALADLPRLQRTNLGKAVTEACRHVLAIGVGTIEFGVSVAQGTQFVEVVVTESASVKSAASTDQPADVVESSSLQRIGELVDRFRLDGEPGEERVIRLSQMLPPRADPLAEDEVIRWAEVLQQKTVEDALVITQRRARAIGNELTQRDGREQLQQQLDAEARPDETTALLSLVASKTDNAVVILNTEGTVDWINDAVTKMTGYVSDEVIEKSLTEFLFGRDTDPETVRDLGEAIRHGHSLDEEFLIYRKDGQTRWTQLSVTPVRDEHGQVTRWIAIGSDITRRRQAQAALQSAKDSAEASNRAKSQFLANMSHEIRTPMNAIMGMTDLALSTTLSNEVRNYLTTAKLSSESLLELLNDILDLSKIEAGRMEIENVDFELASLLGETLNTLGIKAKEKGLDLTSDLPNDIPLCLRGDLVRVRQVLVNLVGNAIKFTEQGEVAVTVEKQWQSNDEVGLHFSVRDTGIGIPSDRLERIFEAFTQVDNSTTRHYGGTGLGLTITAELLHLMRGRIWVESKVGIGSTFHFSLRFQFAEGGVDFQPTEQAPEGGSLETCSTRSLRILIADDHAANRELATQILQRRGHTCEHAADGNEVLTAVERTEFDMILIDIQMPNLDGFQTTQAVRRREQETGTHLPIIALTAHAMQGDRDRCLSAGMDAYLSKPIQARELYTLVETIGTATPIAERTTLEPISTDKEFDFGPALGRLEGDVELLKDQMQYFLDDAPKLLEQIRTAIKESDAKTLHITAHRLKGLVASYDAGKATKHAQELERMGEQTSLTDATKTLDRLESEMTLLKQAIEVFIKD